MAKGRKLDWRNHRIAIYDCGLYRHYNVASQVKLCSDSGQAVVASRALLAS